MCHSAERSLQKIDTRIARFPARSLSFSAFLASRPYSRMKGDVKANRVDLRDPGGVPEKPARGPEGDLLWQAAG
jgi:hypothetical protein